MTVSSGSINLLYVEHIAVACDSVGHCATAAEQVTGDLIAVASNCGSSDDFVAH